MPGEIIVGFKRGLSARGRSAARGRPLHPVFPRSAPSSRPFRPLPVTGTYAITIDPDAASVGSMTLTLS